MNDRQHGRLQLQAAVEKRAMAAPIHITGYTFTDMEALVVSLAEGGHTGRAEAEGVYYRGDSPRAMREQLEALRPRIEQGISRAQLLDCLPPGGARNALDCALWDLEAKQAGAPVWQLAGTQSPQALRTTFTIGAGQPADMAEQARAFADAKALKLKLTDDERNAARVRAVRVARPDVWLMVDANQGFTRESFARLLPDLREQRVALVEQPFPVGREAWLDGLDSPVPIAADESVQDHHDLARLVGRVQTINIKLDKCGGLTEGLAMADQASEMGFDLMVGNMCGTSLAMAPAFVLGQRCQVVDLDGPLALTGDCDPGVRYEHGTVWCPDAVWGGPSLAAA